MYPHTHTRLHTRTHAHTHTRTHTHTSTNTHLSPTRANTPKVSPAKIASFACEGVCSSMRVCVCVCAPIYFQNRLLCM